MSGLYFGAVLFYVVGVIGYSCVLAQQENRADFVIGSRSFGPIRIAFSLVTSWFSAGGLMYYYTLIATDLPTMLTLTASAAIGLLIFSFLVPNFYKRAVEKHYITMTEYVTGDIGKFSGSICAIIIPLLFLCYFLFELIASGLLLSELTGISYIWCICLSAGVVGCYLALGGFKVLMNSDFIQASLLFFFFILLISLFSEQPEIDFNRFFEHENGTTAKGLLGAFIGFFLAATIAPDTWQRALCAKSAKDSRNGLRLASITYVLVYGGLALVLMALFSLRADVIEGGGYRYMIFEYAHPVLGALLLTALVAAMMSTLDTIMFVTSQSLSTDIAYLFGKRLDHPRRLLQIAILLVVIGSIVAAYFVRDIGFLFWFMLSYWVSFVPCLYLFWIKHKPSDKACALSMLLIIAGVSALHMMGLYQEYLAVYFLIGGLVAPKLIDLCITR